jgi:phage gp45-like
MPITIKELLASDTISQATDKINFNFDQLLLNGGGPEGPIGPLGPQGPVGGRGLRGTQWYEDPAASPGTNPNSLIFINLLEGDSYLQSDGTVWEYNGTVWIVTAVNLTGPQGLPGISAGFGYFGQTALVNENTIYPNVMPSGIGGGANTVNQGVPAVMLGGVVSNTTPVPSISFTTAYQIDNNIAQSIGSEITSLFIHQKDSTSSSITFHGGGFLATDKFEQNIIGNLSTIGLGIDDRLVFTVPKPATTPTQIDDLVGLEFITTKKGQRSYSGKAIEHYTGLDTTTPVLGSEYSDYRIVVGQSNPSIQPKFSVSVSTPSSTLQLGGSITFPGNPTISSAVGSRFLLDVVNAQILTSGQNLIVANDVITIRSNNSNVDTTALGNISHVSANLINTVTSGISNNVTSSGNITHTIFNGAFSSRASAGSLSQANTPLNLVGWSYLYSRNGIDLNANATGSQILLTSQGSVGLTAVTQNITLTASSANVQVNAPAGQIDLTGLRVNIQATGAAGGSGGRIDLTTSFDDINIVSARGVNILTGTTGATQTFDVGAGTIDIFSNLNTTINAGGASSILSLLSGNNIVLTATNIIDVNCNNLDIDATAFITIDGSLIALTSTLGTLIQSSASVTISGTSSSSQVTIQNSKSRTSAAANTTLPTLPIQIVGEVSPSITSLTGVGRGIIVTRTTPVIASGTCTYTAVGSIDDCVINWIKIGSIVQVNGYVDYNTGTGNGVGLGLIPLPIIMASSSDINGLYGNGTAYIESYIGGGGNSYAAKMVPVEVKQGQTGVDKFYFVCVHEPTTTASGGDTDARFASSLQVEQGVFNGVRQPKDSSSVGGWTNVINAKSNIRFSFSYRLEP